MHKPLHDEKTTWEQRRLGELCSFAKGRGYSKIDIRDSGVPLILYGRLYTQYQTKIEEVDTFTVEKVIIAGRLPQRSTLSCHTVPRRAATC